MNGEIIEKYFNLTDKQREQYNALFALYSDWNAKINVISRKDIDNLYEHHVLHSLAIAKVMDKGSMAQAETEPLSILDLGTGGGFPGIPLAVMYPQHRFKLIDSIGKKVRVAESVGNSIGLSNCRYSHIRAQEDKDRYDIVVSRAVMDLGELLKIVKCKTRRLICLKGGNVEEEIENAKRQNIKVGGKDLKVDVDCYGLNEMFSEEWFEEKYLIDVKLS